MKTVKITIEITVIYFQIYRYYGIRPKCGVDFEIVVLGKVVVLIEMKRMLHLPEKVIEAVCRD